MQVRKWPLRTYVLFLVISAGLLTACMNNNNGKSSPEFNNESIMTEKTVITLVEYGASPQRAAALQEQLRSFEKQNPDIRASLVVFESEKTNSTMLSLVEENAAIDVFSVRAHELPNFYERDLLVNLTDQAEAWGELAQMHEMAMMYLWSEGEQIYFIPNRFHQPMLYYRKDWFDAKALQVPQTWQELYFVGKQLTSVKDNQYGYAFLGGEPGVNDLIQVIQDYNGQMVDPNKPLLLTSGETIFSTPQALEALSLYREMVIGLSPTAAKVWRTKERIRAFTEGQTAMLIADADAIETIQGKLPKEAWATAPIPLGAGGDASLAINMSGWAIPKHSEHQEEAWRLIQFLAKSDTNNSIAAASGIVPIYKMSKDTQQELFLSAPFAPYRIMHRNAEQYHIQRAFPDNNGDIEAFVQIAADLSWEYIVRRMGGKELLQLLDEAAREVSYRLY